MPADIISAAVQLFGEQGYERASMREIAARAGCSPANLYHHHRSKYQLFVTIIERAMQLHLAGLRDALAAGDDAVDQLRRVLTHHLRLHMERPEVRLLGEDFRPLRGEERTRFIAERNQYERGVRDIVAQGPFDVEDASLAVKVALTACTQVDRWYRPDGELSSEEVARRIAGFLLAGFRVREGAAV